MSIMFRFSFFFNDPATTEIYTLSLHDALPICESTAWRPCQVEPGTLDIEPRHIRRDFVQTSHPQRRSEEHTSELQSLTISYAVFCLKKKKKTTNLSRKLSHDRT